MAQCEVSSGEQNFGATLPDETWEHELFVPKATGSGDLHLDEVNGSKSLKLFPQTVTKGHCNPQARSHGHLRNHIAYVSEASAGAGGQGVDE